jgi:hypothetical protein
MAIIEGGLSSQIQEVDSVSLASRVTLYDKQGNRVSKKHREGITTSSQEALLIAGKNDDIATLIRTDRKGNILTGNYIPEIIENFEGATTNVQKWSSTATTFVLAQSTIGGLNLNSTSLATINAVSILQSQRLIYKYPRVPIQYKQRVRVNIATNSVFDMGFGVPTSTTLIVPNGCAVRCVNGLWTAVITYNGLEIAITNIVGVDGVTQLSTSATNSEYYVIDIIIDDDNLVVTIQDTNLGTMVGKCSLPIPLSALKMWGATALPIYTRVYNTGSAPATAPNVIITELQVLTLDMNNNMDASQIAGNLGLTAGRNPFTGSQLENHTNSTAPVSATLSNTAAGYTTLGGKWQFAAVGGGVTDYILFGFQVPAGSKFLCEGIRIDTRNTGVAVATTPTTLEWSMGFNSSAVSLATANIIRRQLGHQSFAVGAAVESIATPLDIDFKTPEITESGRFVQVILNLPVGTATASQIIRGTCTVKGRFI